MKTAAVLLFVAGLAVLVGVSSWRSQEFEPPRPTLPPPPPPLSPAEAAEAGQRQLRAAEEALAELRARHAALAGQLEAAKEEADRAKATVTFSYGTNRESGRFVGKTLRLGLEAALEKDPEVARRMKTENRINELSLGPFIRDADLIEADPERFAEFQGGLVSEMLAIEERHAFEVEALLAAFKKESMRVEPGSPTWALLDQNVRERITALMSVEARAAKTEHLRFFEYYGMLLIPAYAALGEP